MAKRTKKKKAAKSRRINLTVDHFETIGKLASVGCSQEDIVTMLDGMGLKLSVDTLQRRLKDTPQFAKAYERGLVQRNVKLRSRMMQQAMMMNGAGVHMAQFLAVNFLGMSHKIERKQNGSTEAHVKLTTARERIAAKLEAISQRLDSSEAWEEPRALEQMAPLPVGGGN
jgi:hypothetical protein